jgi:hypothetical protein
MLWCNKGWAESERNNRRSQFSRTKRRKVEQEYDMNGRLKEAVCFVDKMLVGKYRRI